jgi:predicted nucleic acid-binding protein
MKKVFVDTNLIVYANDNRDEQKQEKAIRLISDTMRNGNGVISTQVLQEYAQVALTKLGQSQNVVLRQLVLLEAFEVITLSPPLIRRGVEIRAAYGISFWDSLIVAAAESGKCETVLSEDLNPGQFYSGIVVINPLAD